MDAPIFNGFLIFSHVIPAIVGFLGIIVLANGIMDRRMEFTIGGIALFFGAGILPFLILPYIIGM